MSILEKSKLSRHQEVSDGRILPESRCLEESSEKKKKEFDLMRRNSQQSPLDEVLGLLQLHYWAWHSSYSFGE